MVKVDDRLGDRIANLLEVHNDHGWVKMIVKDANRIVRDQSAGIIFAGRLAVRFVDYGDYKKGMEIAVLSSRNTERVITRAKRLGFSVL